MDSPETEKAASGITTSTAAAAAAATIFTSSSESPPVHDSPIFSYISNLSPIRPVKAAHVAQGFLELSSPPLVFTSPRINPLRETSSLKRHRFPQPSSAEFSRHDDRSKKTATSLDVSGKSVTQLSSGLIVDTQKDLDSKDSVQPCSSSGCFDECVADPVKVDSANYVHSDDSSLKQSSDLPQSSQGGSRDLKKTTAKFNDKNDMEKDVETATNASLALLERAEEELRQRSISEVKPVKTEGKQSNGERPSTESLDVESNMSVDHPSTQQQCEQSVVQIVQAHIDCDGNAGAIANEPLGNKMLCDSKASQHQRGMLRRCLQFEDAQPSPITNSPSSWNPTNIVTKSSCPASPVDLEIVDSNHAELIAASSDKRLANLSQPSTTMFSSQSSGKSCFTVTKPSGIGLHLNSIVNALPMGCGATASMKLTERNYLSVQRMKSESLMNCASLENIKGSTISSNIIEKVSDSIEDVGHDTEDSNAQGSAASQCPHKMEPLDSPLLLKQTEHSESPRDKRKSNSEHADNFEEFNKMSPPKKRKKSSSTNDGDSCKRCNCKKTKCLKLYCDCFAAGIYCAEPCACQGCFNKPEYEDTVLETRQQIEARNPLAFAPKILQGATVTLANSGEDGNWSIPSTARHKRGCNCKKSMCLKKYCECYQANVGCSDGCRCEGCKNVYGRKEEYGLTKQIVSEKASDESLEGTCHEKLGIVATQNKFLNTKFCNPQSLTPLTPSLQYSDHGKGGSKLHFPSRRYLPSPESDLTILSSCEKFPRSPRNSETHDMLLKAREEILDIVSCDQEINYGNAEVAEQFTPNCGFANMCHLTQLPNTPSTAMASSASFRTREWTNVSQSQLCPGSGRPSSAGSLRWRSSLVTAMTQLDTTKFLQGLDSDSRLYDIVEDGTPELLKDISTPSTAVKVSSPNRKRVSPPHSHLHELGSSSSAGLRSGRKFILQAVPSFPPLTPYIKSKSSRNENENDQGGNISK